VCPSIINRPTVDCQPSVVVHPSTISIDCPSTVVMCPSIVNCLTVDCRPSVVVRPLLVRHHLLSVCRPSLSVRHCVSVNCPTVDRPTVDHPTIVRRPSSCVHSLSTINHRPTIDCRHVSVRRLSLSSIVIHLVCHCPLLSSSVVRRHAYHIISAVARNGEEMQEKKKVMHRA